MAIFPSPDTRNLSVKRGFMSMQLVGEAGYTDMGFCQSAELQMHPTLLHYYSPRDGVRKKVLSTTTQLDATLMMVLNEQTARNMGVALMAAGAGPRLDFMSQPTFYASLQFTDTSTNGPLWNAVIPLALLTPKQGIELIAKGSGDWFNVSITCDVQFSIPDNSFGWMETV